VTNFDEASQSASEVASMMIEVKWWDGASEEAAHGHEGYANNHGVIEHERTPRHDRGRNSRLLALPWVHQVPGRRSQMASW